MNILVADKLSLAAGHVPLLSDVQFRLDAGEKVGLIGRNGTGKSSLLKILAGVTLPDSGHVARQNGLKMVYVAQEPELDMTHTVFQALASGLGDVQNVLRQYYELSQVLDHSSESLQRLNELQLKLEALDGWRLDMLVHRGVEHLQLAPETLVGALSGGQKKRLALLQATIQQPDVLLLDEPTNHLDIEGIMWLEKVLKDFAGSLITVTHDRRFLDNVVGRIVELDRGILRQYPGNFAAYSVKKAEELAAEVEQNRLFDKFHAQEEAWICKGVEARRTRNEGRVKRLEELRRQRALRRESVANVNFSVKVQSQSSKLIAELQNVGFSYGDKTLIQPFSTTIRRGDKVGLIGKNGVGKTTLLKLILGQLQPSSGKIKRGEKQEVAYFDQFRSSLNENDTVFYTLGEGNDYVEVGGKRRHVMGYLEDFLFHPARAQSPVASLSGGERNRLLLAKLFTRPANILVLDEPTNDLDIETQELLEEMLRYFEGTVFLVSHDRMFLDQVITQSIVFEERGVLKEYIGGWSDYEETKAREEALKPAVKDNASEKLQVKQTVKQRERVRSAKLSYKEQRELEALPETIAALESEQQALEVALSDGALFQMDYAKGLAMNTRLAELAELIPEKTARWVELEDLAGG